MIVLSVMLLIAFAILVTIAIAEIRDVHAAGHGGTQTAAALRRRAARCDGD